MEEIERNEYEEDGCRALANRIEEILDVLDGEELSHEWVWLKSSLLNDAGAVKANALYLIDLFLRTLEEGPWVLQGPRLYVLRKDRTPAEVER